MLTRYVAALCKWFCQYSSRDALHNEQQLRGWMYCRNILSTPNKLCPISFVPTILADRFSVSIPGMFEGRPFSKPAIHEQDILRILGLGSFLRQESSSDHFITIISLCRVARHRQMCTKFARVGDSDASVAQMIRGCEEIPRGNRRWVDPVQRRVCQCQEIRYDWEQNRILGNSNG